MSRIITISRQFGSGGRTIGKLVAEKLGVRCYDKELIEKTAEETGDANEYIEQEAEYAPGTGFFAYSFLGRGTDGLANADRIWIAQRKVITDIVSRENILKDEPDCFNVFVWAPDDFRAHRIVEQYGESPVKPLKRLEEKDKKRKLNYRYFTGREWGERENYHLCIDSSRVGIERAADLIIMAAEND